MMFIICRIMKTLLLPPLSSLSMFLLCVSILCLVIVADSWKIVEYFPDTVNSFSAEFSAQRIKPCAFLVYGFAVCNPFLRSVYFLFVGSVFVGNAAELEIHGAIFTIGYECIAELCEILWNERGGEHHFLIKFRSDDVFAFVYCGYTAVGLQWVFCKRLYDI